MATDGNAPGSFPGSEEDDDDDGSDDSDEGGFGFDGFESRQAIENRVNSKIRALMDSTGEPLDPTYRQRHVIATGTGATRLVTSLALHLDGREIVDVQSRPPNSFTFSFDGEGHDDWTVTILDSISESQLKNTIEQVVPADHENRAGLVELLAEEHLHTFVLPDGRARDVNRGLASFARYAENFEPIADAFNADHCVSTLIPALRGGGTASSGHTAISEGLRAGFIPSASEGGHDHTVAVQMPSITDDTKVETVGGQVETIKHQAFNGIQRAVEDVNQRYVSRNLLVSMDRAAISQAARQDERGKDWVDDLIGGPTDPVNWEAIKSAVTTDRAVRHRRTPGSINQEWMMPLVGEQVLTGQPGFLKYETRGGDVDPADVRDTFLRGETFVPMVLTASSIDDLQGRHDYIARPDTYEQAVAVLSRLLPRFVDAPVDFTDVTDVFFALGVGGDQEPSLADIDIVEQNLAAEVGVSTANIDGMVLRGMNEWRFPNGPNWLVLLGFAAVENPVDDYQEFV